MADTCIVVAGPGSLERGELAELVEIANREDGNVRASESRALNAICDGAFHAMAAGDALMLDPTTALRPNVSTQSDWDRLLLRRPWIVLSLPFGLGWILITEQRAMRPTVSENK